MFRLSHHLKKSRPPAYALATILVLLGVALFATGALVTISILESKISNSQKEGLIAYYSAEAGIQDAMWKFNNVASYDAGLRAGNLNASAYSLTLAVDSTRTLVQKVNVSIQSTSPGYATVTSTGLSDNSNFTAQRVVQATVHQGVSAPPSGYAVIAGGAINLNNPNNSFNISGGDLYSGGAITANNRSSINASNKFITSSNSCSCSGSNITISGGTVTNATTLTPPTFDFATNTTNATASYDSSSLAAFETTILSAGGLPGPITYYNGALSISNSWAKNKNLTINGILIVNGSLTINASGSNIKVKDPGGANANKSGIFVENGTTSINSGQLIIAGVLYSSGSITVNNTDNAVINGGLISPSGMTFLTGVNYNITLNQSAINATMGAATPASIQLQHWEEQY